MNGTVELSESTDDIDIVRQRIVSTLQIIMNDDASKIWLDISYDMMHYYISMLLTDDDSITIAICTPYNVLLHKRYYVFDILGQEITDFIVDEIMVLIV